MAGQSLECLASVGRLACWLASAEPSTCADIRSVGAPQRRVHAPPAAGQRQKSAWLTGWPSSKESLRRVPPQAIASALPNPRPVANEQWIGSSRRHHPVRAKARGWDFIPPVSIFFYHPFFFFVSPFWFWADPLDVLVDGGPCSE